MLIPITKDVENRVKTQMSKKILQFCFQLLAQSVF